jgi:hypothetical protein
MNPLTQRLTEETAQTDKRLLEAGYLQEHIDRFREFRWSYEYLNYIADFGHDSREEIHDVYKREVRGLR